MKIAINKCYGGYGLSPEAIIRFAELSGFPVYAYADDRTTSYQNRMFNRVPLPIAPDNEHFLLYWLKTDLGERIDSGTLNKGEWLHERDIERNNPILIKVIEELGEEKSSGEHAELKIIEIPDGIDYEIDDYDGIESVSEVHRTWS